MISDTNLWAGWLNTQHIEITFKDLFLFNCGLYASSYTCCHVFGYVSQYFHVISKCTSLSYDLIWTKLKTCPYSFVFGHIIVTWWFWPWSSKSKYCVYQYTRLMFSHISWTQSNYVSYQSVALQNKSKGEIVTLDVKYSYYTYTDALLFNWKTQVLHCY